MTSHNHQEWHRRITELDEPQTLSSSWDGEVENLKRVGLVCPNCGADLEGRKCKLLCVRAGCGYQVTCSEW